jgi:multidrug efflux system membrane fusion protein
MTPDNVSRVAIAAIALAACSEVQATQPGAPPPTPVGAMAVELRQVDPANELSGRVEAVSQVEIRARVGGYVTAVRYREGEEVAAGAVLFTIDARPYQAALARATADLTRARARVAFTRSEAARAEKLLAQNAIANAERDTLASLAVQAEAEEQAARATVELARLEVEFTQVRAPIAGRTGQALVTRGDYVAAGPAPTLLTTIVSVDPVHVYFTGDEQSYLRFASHANNAPIFVGLADEEGFPHAGKVDFVDNRLDAATGTIRVRAVVPNPDKRFTPGLYARVRIGEGTSVKAMLVDDKAILTDQDRKYVYTVGAGDAVERRDIKLGRVIDGLRVVTDGLKPGDRVIVSGIQKIFPGAKVAVTNKQAGVTP